MKLNKIIGVSALVAILTLTGCGKSDKLVCTAEGYESTAEVVVSFKDDKADKYKISISYEDEETAKLMYESYEPSGEDKIELVGNKVIVEYTAESMKEVSGAETIPSKEEVKRNFEYSGYTCK